MSALPVRGKLICPWGMLLGDPALPTTGRTGGDVSTSCISDCIANAFCLSAGI